jgi:hypothetical protein
MTKDKSNKFPLSPINKNRTNKVKLEAMRLKSINSHILPKRLWHKILDKLNQITIQYKQKNQ